MIALAFKKLIKNHSEFLIVLGLLLLSQPATAITLQQWSPQQWAKIKKMDLPKRDLNDRMQWLKAQIPDRIPNVINKLKGQNKSIAIIVYKKQRRLEVWLKGQQPQKLKTYTMTAFSGKLGPKKKQGDKQIPEGIYRANRLNPNSQYYLSIGLNYPNRRDKKWGKKHHVKNLGSDIFIHGRSVTIGCVPIGDHSIEELFYIVGLVGLKNTEVLIAPTTLPLPSFEDLNVNGQDPLMREKYSSLAAALAEYQ